jgi:transposase
MRAGIDTGGRLAEEHLERRPARLACVAQANKTARIVWALLARGGSYRAPAGAQTASA